MKDNMRMFCFQCQETARGRGCTLRGVCGKVDEVANLQDLLIWVLKGLSFYGVRARGRGFVDADVDRFVLEALFATITNANFDPARFETLIHEAVEMRDRIAGQAGDVKGAPEPATWHPGDADLDDLIAKGERVGVLYPEDVDEDIRSLRETLTYGIKGMAAYIDHAYVLGAEDEDLLGFMQEGLAATLDDGLSTDDLVNLVLECGHRGVQAMALLDSANTGTYGNPEPTDVSIGVKEGPAILISGHDLRDMEELLKQTEGTGINVYTHGEMLPANAYPAFKKYDHLAGNYGGSWWRQQDEFEKFGGAILLTTNCLVPPKDSYSDRLFTTGTVGWPGVAHISDREDGKPKDFGPVIERALASDSPEELETGTIPIGFAHAAVTGIADQIVGAVKAGKIKRFVVMSGCDGRFKTRSYFTEIAEAFPQDYVILTSGCAKYRYNKLGLGDIDGIPRVLDMGQCNDSYSAVVIAQKLAEAFGVEDVNDLPLSFDVAWYEQKAVLVLLALLALGIRNIHLGPTLPAFLSSNVLNVLVEKFNIQPTDTVEQDLELIAAGS